MSVRTPSMEYDRAPVIIQGRPPSNKDESCSFGKIAGGVGIVVAIGLAWIPLVGSQITAKICKDIHEDEDISKANLAWAYPLNGIVNLLAVALQPIGSLIAFVAMAILGSVGALMYCFSKDLSEGLFEFAGFCLDSALNISYIPALLARTVYPACKFEEIKDLLR